MSIKKFFTAFVIYVGFCGPLYAATPDKPLFTLKPNDDLQTPQTIMAEASALLDGIATYKLLQKGGKELNPIMPKSKKGVIVATAVKIGVLAAIDAYARPDIRDESMAAAAGVFAGAAFHNALQSSGAKNKVSLPVGVAVGIGHIL